MARFGEVLKLNRDGEEEKLAQAEGQETVEGEMSFSEMGAERRARVKESLFSFGRLLKDKFLGAARGAGKGGAELANQIAASPEYVGYGVSGAVHKIQGISERGGEIAGNTLVGAVEKVSAGVESSKAFVSETKQAVILKAAEGYDSLRDRAGQARDNFVTRGQAARDSMRAKWEQIRLNMSKSKIATLDAQMAKEGMNYEARIARLLNTRKQHEQVLEQFESREGLAA